jgi:hypothetical protein
MKIEITDEQKYLLLRVLKTAAETLSRDAYEASNVDIRAKLLVLAESVYELQDSIKEQVNA